MKRPDIFTAKPQEIFDYVVTHLAEQGARAYNEETGACRYRAADGKMCAVGCLLTDDLYEQTLEGEGIIMLPLYDQLSIPTRRLLTSLQNTHDDPTTAQIFERRLRITAEQYQLSTVALDSLSPIQWKS